ncbi:MAG: aldehyde dehydrogenase family protein, partial [Bdellovibrionaceae bacterium]|nr:aldehyde dehydrogenase family protein [Pseudobdellovibrionaceae bacterium]
MSFQTVNPWTGEVLGRYFYQTDEEILAKVEILGSQNHGWLSLPERLRLTEDVAKALETAAHDISRQMSLEMGKPLTESKAELAKAVAGLRWFAQNGEAMLRTELIKANYSKVEIIYEPMGLILAIMPWNFPVWQFIRVLAPALITGNSVLLKPAELTAGTSQMMVSALRKVLPEGLVDIALVGHEQVEKLIAHQNVAAVTLTGSTRAGRIVGELAGRHLKKCVLELGGNDAAVVFADADLEVAAQAVVKSRLQNAGQSCIATKRLLIEEKVRESFLHRVINLMSEIQPSNPLETSTRMGPLASQVHRKTLISQVQKAQALGGKILLGGTAPEGPSAAYPVTVIEMKRWPRELLCEEFFGPVLLVGSFSSEEEAIALVNSSPYGLGGSVFTRDMNRADRVTRKVRTGLIVVNEMPVSYTHLT